MKRAADLSSRVVPMCTVLAGFVANWASGCSASHNSVPESAISVAGGSGSGAAGTTGQAPLRQCPAESCVRTPPLPDAEQLGFHIKECCTSTGECGTALNGAECLALADPHPDCPPVVARGVEVPTCCTPIGRCGIDFSAFTIGCMSFEDIGALIAAFVTVPPPTPCTPR